jgi:neutral ceramidase
VEEAFGNKMTCLFMQGAAGDIESLIISSRRKGPDDPFKSDYRTIERVGELLAWETVKLAKSLPTPEKNEVEIKYMDDSLQFNGRFKKDTIFNIHISTILINNNIAIATCPGEPFVRLQLEWKKKMRDASATPFLFGYTWYNGTWPNYIPDIQSAARGGYGADQSWPEPLQIGAGETIMNKHLENFFRLNGLMRNEYGPIGFKGGSQWVVTEIQNK